MGHNSVVSGHPKPIGIPWVYGLMGYQWDPRVWGVIEIMNLCISYFITFYFTLKSTSFFLVSNQSDVLRFFLFYQINQICNGFFWKQMHKEYLIVINVLKVILSPYFTSLCFYSSPFLPLKVEPSLAFTLNIQCSNQLS